MQGAPYGRYMSITLNVGTGTGMDGGDMGGGWMVLWTGVEKGPDWDWQREPW